MSMCISFVHQCFFSKLEFGEFRLNGHGPEMVIHIANTSYSMQCAFWWTAIDCFWPTNVLKCEKIMDISNYLKCSILQHRDGNTFFIMGKLDTKVLVHYNTYIKVQKSRWTPKVIRITENKLLTLEAQKKAWFQKDWCAIKQENCWRTV